MLDYRIAGGTVVDGSGAERFTADVETKDGRLTHVGPASGEPAKQTIDAEGLIVAPGFIDCHTHYDAQVFWDPAMTSSCWHGVTTVIVGNCGFGIAPCRPEHRDLAIRTLQHVEGMSAEALAAGITWEFETFPQYLDAVARRGPAVNFGAYVGHTPVRLWAMGEDAYERAATEDELAVMRSVVREAMAAGAVGFSTSSSPTHNGDKGRPVPSRHADPSEFEALVSVVGEAGRGVIEITPGLAPVSLPHAYEWARATGRPLTWAALLSRPDKLHYKMLEMHRAGVADGAPVWPQVACRPLVLEMTMAEPFVFEVVSAFSDLMALSREERIARYRDPGWRERAAGELAKAMIPIHYDRIRIVESPKDRALEGTTVADVAARRGTPPLDLMLDLALADGLEGRFATPIGNDDPDEVAFLLQQEDTIIGLSDAGAHANQLCDACFSTELLGTWVRERPTLSLERAVWRLTGQLAGVFGLEGRGYLRPGGVADVVVFDPETVAPGPLRRVHDLPGGGDRLVADRPRGVVHVLVNGVPIQLDGRSLVGEMEERPGRVLRG